MNINNHEDKFGKTVGELTAAWMTLTEEARQLYADRVDYHTERVVMSVGFPDTGYTLSQVISAVSQIAVASLIVDGYVEVTDKGFAPLQNIEPEGDN